MQERVHAEPRKGANSKDIRTLLISSHYMDSWNALFTWMIPDILDSLQLIIFT